MAGSFKIDELTAKTSIVDADLYMIGDSEDLSGSDKTIKKVAHSSLANYILVKVGAGTTKYLTSADSPFTITDGDGFGTFICDTSSGDINITIPTLADNQDRNLEFIHQTGGNTLNIDGEGAETIDGLTDIDLPKQGDRLKIKGTTSEWAITDERISCQLRLNTFAGYGSTDSYIMRFANGVENYGNVFSENHSTGYNGNTEGLEITINKAGKYSFSYTATGTGGASQANGLTLNSAQLTTSIVSTNAADTLCINSHSTTAIYTGNVFWSGYLSSGDIIRAHADAVTAAVASQTHFTATYEGN